LLEGVKLFGDFGVGMWKKVAIHIQSHLKVPLIDEKGNIVDTKITNHQCGERYKHHLDPTVKARKIGPWSPDEVC
jgi:hypothetical protein